MATTIQRFRIREAYRSGASTANHSLRFEQRRAYNLRMPKYLLLIALCAPLGAQPVFTDIFPEHADPAEEQHGERRPEIVEDGTDEEERRRGKPVQPRRPGHGRLAIRGGSRPRRRMHDCRIRS